jgi:hypothetical protein
MPVLKGTKRTTYAESRTTGSSGTCRAKAPCGDRCCLEAFTPHMLHCCKNPNCLCHSELRYQADKARREAVKEPRP